MSGTSAVRSGWLMGSLLLAWVIGSGLLLGGAAGGALIGLGAGLALLMALPLWGALGRVEVERVLPCGPVRAGEAISLTLRLHSRRWWPWLFLRVADLEPASREARWEGRLSVLTCRTVEVSYCLPSIARGVHRFGAVRLLATDPFGLVQQQHLIDLPGELVVWPIAASAHHVQALLPSTWQSGMAVGTATASGETCAVRPYVPGDAPRQIHWPASAKTGRLLTRQEEGRGPSTLHITLEPPPDQPAQLEQALSQAAALVEWGLGHRFTVALRAAQEYVPPATGPGQRQRLMRLLAAYSGPVAATNMGARELGAQVIRVTGEGAACEP